ncbi:ABC transporter ATP-binding protein [Anaerocolumna xylanovorans]|uniref:ATP-binding cassette, subfamily C n=1 Tax=Anaerocolumna xylanovorans DSM 12503 TaxID=1121345 RepID=A0A1M7Y1F1_9FIRM|nr:ABC transporter ATP-binding protein [Anaerocolumna xylanovorans]SHO45601.1 ATP-binding cassette, subfamily C [Anaerocolumna xylanovorans DSM 12503]
MNSKAKAVINNLLFIMKYIAKWKKSIFFDIGLYSVFLGLSPFIWIYVPKLLIDELTGQKSTKRITIILASAFLIAGIIGYSKEFLQGRFRMKMNTVRYGFIRMLAEKTMKMDYAYTEDPDILKEVRIAMKTVNNTAEGIGLVIIKLFSIPGNIIGFLIFSIIIIQLNPFIWGLLLISLLLSYLFIDKANRYQRSCKDDLSHEERKSYYASIKLNDFQYGKDIRMYGLKRILLQKKSEADEKVVQITDAVKSRYLHAGIKEGVLMALREGIVYAYLIISVLNKNISISNFVLYTFALNGFVTWMQTTIKDFSDIWVNSLYVSDFREFLKKDEESSSTDSLNPKALQYDIVFDKVSFRYPNSERDILKNFSIHISPGERLALVGINGAGKTTLVKLLTRLYEPTGGRILINGIDIKEYDLTQYRKLFSVVFQDTKLFAFTIRENITMEYETANTEKYQESLRQSGIYEKTGKLEKKEETNLFKILDEEGVEFSGGEIQKLSMARALYKDGDIIIMDEPTAALDALAESRIYTEFDNLIKNKTAVYISHRLSSTRFCDNIAFLENGELKEYGTHEQLMQLGGAYAGMFQIQAEYYREEGHEE